MTARKILYGIGLALGLLAVRLAIAPAAMAQGGCDPQVLTPTVSTLPCPEGADCTTSVTFEQGWLIVTADASRTENNKWLGATVYVGDYGNADVFSFSPESSVTYTQYILSSGEYYESLGWQTSVFGIDADLSLDTTRSFVGWNWGSLRARRVFVRADTANHGWADTASFTFRAMTAIVREGCPAPSLPVYQPPCEGYEVITATTGISLTAGQTWSGWQDTPWSYLYVRYVMHVPEPEGKEIDARWRVNEGETSGVRYPAGHDYYTVTVPSGVYAVGVTGPQAALTVTNRSDAFVLLSACVLSATHRVTTTCNGTEVLTAPVTLAHNGEWRGTTVLTATYIRVKFVIEDPSPPVGIDCRRQPLACGAIEFVPRIEDKVYYERWERGARFYEWTEPYSGSHHLSDSTIELGLDNLGWDDLILHSVCVSDESRSVGLGGCALVNPSFTSEPSYGWDVTGDVTWDPYDNDGAINLSDWAQIYQEAANTRGQMYRMEVWAMGGAGAQVAYGTDVDALVFGGPQVVTESAEATTYTLHYNEIFVPDASGVLVRGNDTDVDLVCLRDSPGVLPVVTCTRPEYDPPSVSDIIEFLVYEFLYVGAVLVWVVCEIVRAISLAVNAIATLIYDLLLRIPMIPAPGSGIISWLEWLGLIFLRFTEWLGFNWQGLVGWLTQTPGDVTDWLWDLIAAIVGWIWQNIFGWALDPTGAQLQAMWNDFWNFIGAVGLELKLEFNDLLDMLGSTFQIMLQLVGGFRGAVAGDEVAELPFTEGSFIYQGIQFCNRVLSYTPLTAMNIVALSIIAIGLAGWTSRKTSKILFLLRN